MKQKRRKRKRKRKTVKNGRKIGCFPIWMEEKKVSDPIFFSLNSS